MLLVDMHMLISDTKELIIIGRGGQGGVTAARILASAAVKDGKWGQAIPEFGAERRGAIVKSYVRISSLPVITHSGIKRADVLIVLSPDIMRLINIDELLKGPDSVVIVNSPTPIKTKYSTHWVDATSISEKLGLVVAGWHIVNVPMLGAFVRVTGLVSLNSLIESLSELIGKGDYVKLNIEAAKLGYAMVRGE